MAQRPARIDLLLKQVEGDETLIRQLKEDPVATLRTLSAQIKDQNPRPNEDKFAYRVCVVILGVVVLAVVGMICFRYSQASHDTTVLFVPEILVALGSTALGALAGLLAPAGGNN
jgi:hypothetical protein